MEWISIQEPLTRPGVKGAVPVTTVALTKVSNFKCKLVARVTISTYATGARAEMTR